MSETVRNDESSSKDIYGDPPKINIKLPEISELTQNSKHWEDVQLPIDILLLTMKDCEFLSCYFYVIDPFRSYFKGLGYVYFGGIRDYQDVKRKVALVRYQYSIDRGYSFGALKTAAHLLRPRAIFSVGYCIGMSPKSTKLGDVVTPLELTSCYFYQNHKKGRKEFDTTTHHIGRDALTLSGHMGDGWRPPIENYTESKAKIHHGQILRGSEFVQAEWQRDELVKSFPKAIAIDPDEPYVVPLAYDMKLEWVIIKGISGYADGTESRENWQTFASVTAASLAFHVLREIEIFEDWPHFEDPIPDYVKARGPVALEAYRRALETGKTFDRRIKIVLSGQDRVGKTSLRRYLSGEAFNKDEASTPGIEMISPVKNAGKGAWRNPASLENTSALDHKSAELVAQVLRSSSEERSQRIHAREVKKTRREPSRGKGVTQERSNDDLVSKEVIERNVFQEIKSERKPEEVPEKVLSLVDHGLKEKDTSDNEDIWPFVWDFAGQAVYHAIHPIFLSQEAIYVLVSDLSKELSAPAQCRMRLPNQDEIVVNSPYVEDTNLDHMMRWLDLVHSLGRPEFQRKSANIEDVLPPVVLVGTHADGVRDPCKEMESVMRTICSVAHPATLGHISKELFFIDNTNPNREDDPKIVSLRAELLNLARKMPHINKVIPLQWLRVEQKVDEMVKKGMHYIGKKRFAEDISGGICRSNGPDDVEELLHFLQARGRVIYQDLPENPEGLVVLDPQWLIKILCEIITLSPPWKNDPIIQRDYQVLGKKGLLSRQLLNRAFKHLELNDIGNSLIHIMESFDIICNSKNCNGEDYPFFVPCMLKSPKKNTRGTYMPHGPLSVFLTFNTNYVPSGLFCRLVVHFLEWASQLCGSCTAPSLFSNAARFNVSEEYQLTLECHKTVIELKIWTMRGSNKMEEEKICEELVSHLERCRSRLSVTCQWLGSVTMELYVKCQLCEPCPDKCRDETSTCILHKVEGCSHFDCGHYISLRSFGLSCEHTVDAVPNFSAEKLDPWVQALKSVERKKRIGGSTEHLLGPKMKRPNEESSPSDTSTPKKRKTLAVKQGVPSDEDLEWLSSELEQWKRVGRRLKIKEARLTAFDNGNKDSSEKTYKMLLHWKKRDSSAATYTILHDALCHPLVNRTDLAEQICCQPQE